MGIGSIVSNVVNYAIKHPKTTTALATGGIGVAALVGYKAATTTHKQANDQLNYMILSNPMLNPLGWFNHAVNPKNTETDMLDNPIVKSVVDRNNKQYQEYYDKLSTADKVKEFYANGGKGVNFDGIA